MLDAVGAILAGVFGAVTSSFVPIVARRLGANLLLMSLLTAVPAAGNLFAVLAAHYVQGRRKLPYMVWAWGLGRGMFLLMLFVSTPLPFVLVVTAFWLLVSLPLPGYVEIMRQIYPDAYRGRAMAYVRVVYTACITLLTPLAGRLLDLWGYRVLFPMAAVFGILSGVAFGQVKFEEAGRQKRRDLLDPWRLLVHDVLYRQYSLAFLVFGLGALLIAPLVPILIVDELQLSYSQVGVLGMINSVFWMVFYIVWGRTVDRRGGFWTIQVNFLLTIGMALSFFLARDMGTAAIGYIFTGITTAGIDLGWMNAIMQFASKDRISDYAVVHAGFVGLRGVISPLLGTALMAVPWIGLRGVFLISASVMLVGWLMLRRVRLPERAAE